MIDRYVDIQRGITQMKHLLVLIDRKWYEVEPMDEKINIGTYT